MARKQVLVVGAGFSGLSIAHHLERAGFEVTIYEQASRVGGLLGTQETSYGLAESGANGILNSSLVEDLFAAADVQLIPTLKEARARFIVRDGKLKRWPLKAAEMFRFLFFVFRYLFFRSSLKPRAHESVTEWGSRVLSPQISKFTIETALQGIYAGDPRELSASLILNRLFTSEKLSFTNRPRFRGTGSAKRGMGELMQGLRAGLQARGVRFELDRAFTASELAQVASAQPVVLACGAQAAAELLKSHDPQRAAALKKIRLLPIVSTTCYFDRSTGFAKGFGFLNPPGTSPVLGVLLNNFIFEGRAKDVLSETWIMGGAMASPDLLEKSDQEIINLIVEERCRYTRAKTHPLSYSVQRWPAALPYFSKDLEALGPQYRPNRGNVYLLGNYTGGIGLARILEQAFELTREIQRTGEHS